MLLRRYHQESEETQPDAKPEAKPEHVDPKKKPVNKAKKSKR